MYKVNYYPRSEVQVDILNKDELSTVTVEIPQFWAVQYLTETTGHTVQKFNNLSDAVVYAAHIIAEVGDNIDVRTKM